MAKSIKGTKTEKNLLAAFAGKSQTRNLYTFFALEARGTANKPGYMQISNIFTETAENERVQGKTLFNYLEGGDVEIVATYPAGTQKDTKSNLESAAAGENREWTTIYPDYAKTAIEEGFPEIASSFEEFGKASKFHESRFRKLANNIANGEVFKKKTSVRWHCINCAYVYEGTEAPKMCPGCKHPQIYYEVLAENY